jgi:WD40 repeat protein
MHNNCVSPFRFTFWVLLFCCAKTLSAQSVNLQVQTGHTNPITLLSINPGGSFIATADDSGNILIWDYEAGRIVRSKVAGQLIKQIAFIDENRLLTLRNNGQLSMFHVSTGKDSTINNNISGIAVSPGQWVAMLDIEGITGFEMSNFKDPVFNIPSLDVMSMAADPAGQYLSWLDDAGLTYLYDIKLKKVVSSKNENHPLFVEWTGPEMFSLICKKPTWSGKVPGGFLIKSYSTKHKQLHVIASDRKSHTFTSLCATSDLLLAGDVKGDLSFFNIKNGRFLRKINLHKGTINALAMHPLFANHLISIGKDQNLLETDLVTNTVIRAFEPNFSPVTALTYQPQLNRMGVAVSPLSSSPFATIGTLDLESSFDFHQVRGNKSQTNDVRISPDNSVLSAGSDNKLIIFDPKNNSTDKKGVTKTDWLNLITEKVIFHFLTTPEFFYFFNIQFPSKREAKGIVTTVDISSSGLIAASGWRSSMLQEDNEEFGYRAVIRLIDRTKGGKKTTLSGHSIRVNCVAFSPSGKLLASCGEDKYIKIWDVAKRKVVVAFKLLKPAKQLIWAGNDSNLIFGNDQQILLLDVANKRVKRNIMGHSPFALSKDNRTLFFQTIDSHIGVWDLESGIPDHKKTLPGHGVPLTGLGLAHHPDIITSAAADGRVIFWNWPKREILATLLIQPRGGFILITPDNYYLGSKSNISALNFVIGNKYYDFEQFDLKFNRPDIVLKRLGLDSTGQTIDLYHKAYLKRLEKISIKEETFQEGFHAPDLVMANKAAIKRQTQDGTLQIRLQASDSKIPMSHINIWNNNVPVFGRKGLKLPDNIYAIDSVFTIPLIAGRNAIQASVANNEGTESLRETINVQYTPIETQKPNLYFIGLGAAHFQQSEADLPNVDKDVKDLSSLFLNHENSPFGKIIIDTLLNQEVTTDKVLKLKERLMQAGPEDVVWVYYGGHGQLTEDLNYYLATYDNDFNDYKARGLAYSTLESLLDSIPPYRRLLMINACHAGESDQDIEIFEKMRETFLDLRRQTGSWIISSSFSYEAALTDVSESAPEGNSNFAKVLLKYLKSSPIKAKKRSKRENFTVRAMGLYLEEEFIRLEDANETSGQHPHIRNSNTLLNFPIWH